MIGGDGWAYESENTARLDHLLAGGHDFNIWVLGHPEVCTPTPAGQMFEGTPLAP